jgi:hypothetical protein
MQQQQIFDISTLFDIPLKNLNTKIACSSFDHDGNIYLQMQIENAPDAEVSGPKFEMKGYNHTGKIFDFHMVPYASRIQPCPEGLMLINSRCWRRSATDVDLNCTVIDKNGAFIRSLCVQDGIQDAQTTPSGTELWTSYFDEGVFGNFGWDGNCGLFAWSPIGDKIYSFSGNGQFYIDDCYAMNVASDRDIYIYFYSAFFLVHIQDKKIVDWWKISVLGSHAFLVKNNVALFCGDYEDRTKLHKIRLQPEHASEDLGFEHLPLIHSNGHKLSYEKLTGRSDRIFAIQKEINEETNDVVQLRAIKISLVCDVVETI